MANQSYKSCFSICLFMTVIISIICGFSIYTQKELYESYEETLCNVSSISYPKNYSDKPNWGVCRCGKHCKAYTPVIKIYVDVRTEYDMTINNCLLTRDYERKSYTFFDSSCPQGKNPESIDKSIIESKKIYNTYFNRSLPCFYNTEFNHAILEKTHYFNNTLIYILLVFIGIFFLCTCCQCVCNFKQLFC